MTDSRPPAIRVPRLKIELDKLWRIRPQLAKRFPCGVPDSVSPKALLAELLLADPSLRPLDDATFIRAIESYNAYALGR